MNTLIQLGMPKGLTDRYGEHVHTGDTLLIVHTTTEEAERARGILDSYHPRVAEGGEPGTTGTVPIHASAAAR